MSVELSEEEYEELKDGYEKVQQLDGLIDIRSDNENPGLEDIWIAGQPVGILLQKLRKDVDEVQKKQEQTPEPNPEPMSPDETDESTSPMEKIIQYSEKAVDEHLTANAERARFMAKDVATYAKKAPVGHVIDSSTVRKVIKAKEGEKPHTQTVARVMQFMDDFGKDEISLKKRRGKNIVVVDKEAAQKYHSRCDGDQATEPENTVIHSRVTG